MDLDRIRTHHERLRKARELLGLDERASLRAVKEAYRALARRWHPDRADDGGRADAEARMKEINEAYALLVEYCESYPIAFGIDSLRETDPFYDHLLRFYHDFFTETYSDDDDEHDSS